MKSRSVFVLVPFWYEFLDSMFQKLRFNKDVNIELPYLSTYSVLVRGTGTEYGVRGALYAFSYSRRSMELVNLQPSEPKRKWSLLAWLTVCHWIVLVDVSDYACVCVWIRWVTANIMTPMCICFFAADMY